MYNGLRSSNAARDANGGGGVVPDDRLVEQIRIGSQAFEILRVEHEKRLNTAFISCGTEDGERRARFVPESLPAHRTFNGGLPYRPG